MANIPIYSGSVDFIAVSASFYNSPPTGSSPTPFGFYDDDTIFKSDANKVADFCARRLGYPIENVELQDIQFWAAFEEATTTYGNELYAFQVRDNMLTLEGAPTGSSLNHTLITPTMASLVRLSEQYGEEAGVGGNVDWLSGSIRLEAGVQDYDLSQWALDNNISGGIEIKEIFYQDIPAVSEMYTPYGNSFGFDGEAAAFSFMGGGYGFGGGFLMMPLSFDIQTIQAIEMSNQVRLSNYTFQLVNNKLRIFPIPGYNRTISGQLVTTRDALLTSLVNISDGIDGIYSISPSTSGDGGGALLSVTITGGVISSIIASRGGSSYIAGNTLTIPAGSLGAGSSPVVITLQTDDITVFHVGNNVNLWFRYIKDEERIMSAFDENSDGVITNASNAPYNNPVYTQINSVGRSWIFEMTLAIVKETLGYVRGKYATVPIPGAEVTLNQSDLLSAATAEKVALVTRLREYLNETSRQSLLERRQAESVARVAEINNVPMTIFIG
jgi:hypothetical protein